MFAVGDMHASMGDGEICGTGIEIAGEVTIRFDLLKGKHGEWPVSETDDAYLTTLNAGSIVLIATFLRDIFPKTEGGVLDVALYVKLLIAASFLFFGISQRVALMLTCVWVNACTVGRAGPSMKP